MIHTGSKGKLLLSARDRANRSGTAEDSIDEADCLSVLIIDDYKPMLEAIGRLVAPECRIVGFVEHGNEAVEASIRLRPDVLLLDISLPGISGIDLLPVLRAALPMTTIIMLTTHNDPAFMKESYRRGADGYVLKMHAVSDLMPTIRMGQTQKFKRRGQSA